MDNKRLTDLIDLFLLKTDSTLENTVKMAELAKNYHLHGVDGVAVFYPQIIESLRNSNVSVGSACGFIMISSQLKALFARRNMEMGCDECEMTMNLPAFKSGLYDDVVREIQLVKEAIGDHALKCIIETPLLTDDEIKKACELVVEGGADYVKTAGGQEGNTTVHHVKIIADALKGRMGFIVAGGINDIKIAEQMIAMGASRIGIDYFSAVQLLQDIEK